MRSTATSAEWFARSPREAPWWGAESRDVPIPFFPSQYRFRYLGSGYQPILSTDPIPGRVSVYTAVSLFIQPCVNATLHFVLSQKNKNVAFCRSLAKNTQNYRAVPPLMHHPCDRHSLLWTQVLQSTQPLKRLWGYPFQNMYCTPTQNLSKSDNNTLSCRREANSATARCQRSSDAGSFETPWPVWLQSWGQRGIENYTDTLKSQKLPQWQRE